MKISSRSVFLWTSMIGLAVVTSMQVGAQSLFIPSSWDLGFAKGPSMKSTRMGHWQATLPNRSAIAFGGHGKGFVALKTADMWSPSTGTFSALTMKYTHDMPAFARLQDGRYLLAGGAANSGVPAYATSEIFNPTTKSFAATGNMVRFRCGAASATLNSGKVLIAGAWWIHNDAHTYGEIYDPATGSFSATGPLKVHRANAIAIPAKDGKAVVVGGMGPQADPAYVESIELYDPATNKFRVLRNTLIAGETGWYINQQMCMRVIDDQKMTDGRYLLIAHKIVDGVDNWMLVAFDPAKKVFVVLPAISDTPGPEQLAFPWAPLVNNENKKAYLIGILTSSSSKPKLVLYSLDLTTLVLSEEPGQFAPSYFLSSCAQSLLKDGRILITGGTKDGTNFGAVANTILWQPPL